MKRFGLLAAALGAASLACLADPALAAEDYIYLNVARVTSTTEGLMVQSEGGALPENCVGSPWNWMLIPEAETAMISLFLTWYAQGKKSFTAYTLPRNGTGYCTIAQLDPGS